MHPVVLHGCSTWDQELLPLDEFSERLKFIQSKIRNHGLNGLIMYSDVRNYAKICYLTNYVPKHSYAVLLIPNEGEPRLLAKLAGTRDVPYVQTLARINDIRPIKDLGEDLSLFLSELNEFSGDQLVGKIGICGKDMMPVTIYDAIREVFKDAELHDLDDDVNHFLQTKRPREITAIRKAAAIMDTAVKGILEKRRRGGSVVTAVVEAERIARNLGAQDVRLLYSLDHGKTLIPFEMLSEDRDEPLVAYIAVDYLGYWAEGMVTLDHKRHLIHDRCSEILNYFRKSLRSGAELSALIEGAKALTKPFEIHPISHGGFGHGIGLSLVEQPHLHPEYASGTVDSDNVYSIYACLTNGENENCLMSAMIMVKKDGNEVIWSSEQC